MATIKIPSQKVILCGDYGVGKSSLFRRFANDTFVASNDRKSTLGLDFFNKPFPINEDDKHDNSKVMLQLWDTGGMERVATVTSSYYKFSEAAILVYSVDNSDSFNSLAQHLIEVASYAENAKIFLCGNKIDLVEKDYNEEEEEENNIVSNDDVESFCEQCQIDGIFRTSCKTGKGVSEMFREISKIISSSSRSKNELLQLEHSFKLNTMETINNNNNNCLC